MTMGYARQLSTGPVSRSRSRNLHLSIWRGLPSSGCFLEPTGLKPEDNWRPATTKVSLMSVGSLFLTFVIAEWVVVLGAPVLAERIKVARHQNSMR